ncbi:Golgi phosphoprotein 3 (GPP34) [Saccharopolyspora antimicrobica]|uniref:Golgi phosphoprotein 3 (GPP34) n=1 Tax=Saccharopolyspora antimicrobica TaxID=455193 RepID=A0A1I4X1G3_9PSEU|nr:Golgi phosphoprotein 3 GPP34 [Saccharopolyspora antimicrobica]SFN19938.1 Golgi phosphoprotein 3 (GPP34) [Saccharopolyspora antimicrobica]
MPLPLSLPEEFVLLSQRETGEVRYEPATSFGCAAAELGELLLRGKIRIWHKERRLFGRAVLIGSGKIELVDSGSTGLVWAEEVLNGLVRRQAAKSKPVTVTSWARHRSSDALNQHRSALLARGLLAHAPPESRRKPDRYFPHPGAREALLAELHASIAGHRPFDGRTFVLTQLANADGLSSEMRRGLSVRTVLKTKQFGDVPPSLLRATSALTSAIPSPSTSGGGDGDGGGE